MRWGIRDGLGCCAVRLWFGAGVALVTMLPPMLAGQATSEPASQWRQEYKEASAALATHDWSHAVAEFSALVKAGQPAPAQARAAAEAGLGAADAALGKGTEAVRALRESLRLDPGRADVHMLLGNQLLILGQSSAALAQMRQAVSLEPQRVAYRLALARALGKTGHQEQAVEELDHLKGDDPQDAEVRFQLGRSFSALTEAAYRRLSANGKGTARLAQARGETYADEGQWGLAAAQFELAIRRDAALIGPRLELARVLVMQHRPDEARQAVQAVLARVPDDADALQMMRQLQAALASREGKR